MKQFCSVALMVALCVGPDAVEAATRGGRAVAVQAKVNAPPGKPLRLLPSGNRARAVAAVRKPSKVVASSRLGVLATHSPTVKAGRRAVSLKVARFSTRTARYSRRPTHELAAPTPAGLTLSAAQREAIYRSIVQTPLQPKPVMTQRIKPPTATTTGSAAATSAMVDADAPVASEPDIGLGATMPPSVPLLELPSTAVDAAPAIAAYRYAFVGDRVLLVDPENGVVAAVLEP